MSNAYGFVIGAGWVLILAGTIQIFHQAINPARGRGAKQAEFDFSRLSFQSTFPGIAMILVGVLLINVGPFGAGR
jgi:multidrug transporter EmrE-like cation transporter